MVSNNLISNSSGPWLSLKHVLILDDIPDDELVDEVMARTRPGIRKYVPCLYANNKIDTISIEEVDKLARQPHSCVVSIHSKLNTDYMLSKMWNYMGLILVYTNRRCIAPDLDDPVVLSNQRCGITVAAAAEAVSKEILTLFHFAYMWGRPTKHIPQRVGLSHVLHDDDIIQLAVKTVTQQKATKDYAAKVQAYIHLVADKRKASTKASKNKHSTG
eukprot:FR736213.1.p1 GENE.FR736213.1~~FR736213.1.p1  ORF type:complete len:216 (+),score=30.08 FR736213.1:52-699(+)